MPSTPVQLAAADGGAAQVPTVAPLLMVHMPVQQSPPRAHKSPVWMQYEAPNAHWPPLQSFEQQSVFAWQVLPAVLQLSLSGWQVPLLHCWLQQSDAARHV